MRYEAKAEPYSVKEDMALSLSSTTVLIPITEPEAGEGISVYENGPPVKGGFLWK